MAPPKDRRQRVLEGESGGRLLEPKVALDFLQMLFIAPRHPRFGDKVPDPSYEPRGRLALGGDGPERVLRGDFIAPKALWHHLGPVKVFSTIEGMVKAMRVPARRMPLCAPFGASQIE